MSRDFSQLPFCIENKYKQKPFAFATSSPRTSYYWTSLGQLWSTWSHLKLYVTSQTEPPALSRCRLGPLPCGPVLEIRWTLQAVGWIAWTQTLPRSTTSALRSTRRQRSTWAGRPRATGAGAEAAGGIYESKADRPTCCTGWRARTGALFGSAAPLTAQEITRLRALAGGAPARTGNVERTALVGGVGPMIEDLHAEADAEALPPADVEDPALEAELHPEPNLADPPFGTDAAECPAPSPEPGLMRTYIEKRLPLNDQKTLQHVSSMAAFGWEAGFKSDNQELMAFASRLLVFSEQVALDSGRIQLGYLLAGFPDPTPLGFNSRRVPGLRTFSRLAPAQWLAANLAYLKDLDCAESRIAQLGTGRPAPPPKAPNAQETAESEEGQPHPRRPPRRPKNRHSECIGVTGRSLARPGLGSHDKCFPEGRRGASPLPVFDSQCTDLIDPP